MRDTSGVGVTRPTWAMGFDLSQVSLVKCSSHSTVRRGVVHDACSFSKGGTQNREAWALVQPFQTAHTNGRQGGKASLPRP